MKFYDIETTGRVTFVETKNGRWARRSDVLQALALVMQQTPAVFEAERDRLLSDLGDALREIVRLRALL